MNGQQPTGAANPPVNDRFGFVWVNNPGAGDPTLRYQMAREAGAGWTRWPIYWHDVEKAPGQLDYTKADAVVEQDRAHGLQINGILKGTPEWASDLTLTVEERKRRLEAIPEGLLTDTGGALGHGIPANLRVPVFTPDGEINPNHLWARFVYTTVRRYQGKVKAWEIWNEPDWIGWFWNGTIEDYYLLLKSGYLAAKKADPTVTVLFGGLCHWCGEEEFFRKTLEVMAEDPTAATNNYFFDALPIHVYVNPYSIFRLARQHRADMAAFGIDKPIWVNEANVPVCGDAEVDHVECPSNWRATLDEQANFVIQVMALGAALRIERTMIFQLYDDGIFNELYGLIRNSGSPRPSYAAFQTAARYLNGYQTAEYLSTPEYDQVVTSGGPAARVTVAWNNTAVNQSLAVPAITGQALLVDKAGRATPIRPVAGWYRLILAPNTYADWYNNIKYIGGDPLFVVELPDPTPTPTPTVTRTPTPVPSVSGTPRAAPPAVTPLRTATPSATPSATPVASTELDPVDDSAPADWSSADPPEAFPAPAGWPADEATEVGARSVPLDGESPE